MADPVTASLIIAAISVTAAGVSAASATVQAEGAKDVADAQNEINQRRIDKEAFSNLNTALAQEGSTSTAFQASVQNVFAAEEEAKWESAYERNIAKHEANKKMEEAWVDFGITAAASVVSVAGAYGEAAKLAAANPGAVATPVLPAGQTVMTPQGATISTLPSSFGPFVPA